MSAQVLTFGCRLNLAESEAMAALAAPGVIVVNTCAVTAEAERQARQAIRRAHRERPDAPIIVTGCAATIAPAAWAALPGVARVVPNADKLAPGTWNRRAAPLPEAGRTRAFLQVQQGCDHRCTFCVIPLGRGPSRSVPVADALAQARGLLARGQGEIVLTGVDLTAYGADLPDRPGLGTLVRALLDGLPGLARLRLSSLDPAEIDDALWGALADDPRLMPHLHLSVQSGDDLILKRMKRRHGRADVLRAADRARAARPGIVLGADLITGFPTESDAAFEATCDLVGQAGIDILHVFPFSPRPATPAARMPQVPDAARRARAGRLRAIGSARAAALARSFVGQTLPVLAERDGSGHTEQFLRVRGVDAAPGRIVPVRIAAAEGSALIGARMGTH